MCKIKKEEFFIPKADIINREYDTSLDLILQVYPKAPSNMNEWELNVKKETNEGILYEFVNISDRDYARNMLIRKASQHNDVRGRRDCNIWIKG